MEMSKLDLKAEGDRATNLLCGKVVAYVARHRAEGVMLEFTDGTRLYVDSSQGSVELSVT